MPPPIVPRAAARGVRFKTLGRRCASSPFADKQVSTFIRPRSVSNAAHHRHYSHDGPARRNRNRPVCGGFHWECQEPTPPRGPAIWDFVQMSGCRTNDRTSKWGYSSWKDGKLPRAVVIKRGVIGWLCTNTYVKLAEIGISHVHNPQYIHTVQDSHCSG